MSKRATAGIGRGLYRRLSVVRCRLSCLWSGGLLAHRPIGRTIASAWWAKSPTAPQKKPPAWGGSWERRALARSLLLRGRGGRGGRVEAGDDGVGQVDGVRGVDQAGLELVEDHGDAHFLADGVDDGLDLRFERLQLAVAGLTDLAVGVLRVALHGDALLGELLLHLGELVLAERDA